MGECAVGSYIRIKLVPSVVGGAGPELPTGLNNEIF